MMRAAALAAAAAALFSLAMPAQAIFDDNVARAKIEELRKQVEAAAKLVEERHYPEDAPGAELSGFTAVSTALSFGLVVLLVNIAILPALFFGVGAIAIVAANAYLLSREYFEMVAMRHMPASEAKRLRRENSPQIFIAGFIPAFFAAVPVINLIVPLFATSYFTHFFKKVSQKL